MEKKRIIRYGAAFISLAVLFVIILVASINTGSVHTVSYTHLRAHET